MSSINKQTEVVVLGSGPGGYTAAFRAADLGKKVILVERYSKIGGVCLNVGCIPSKALLHKAAILTEAHHTQSEGIDFGKPNISLDKICEGKNSVINQMTGGLKLLAQQRKVEIIQGTGTFMDTHTLQIKNEAEEIVSVQFEEAIIATGSSPIWLPYLPQDPRIMTSTGALALEDIPKKLLIIGGGIIGLEMATVYQAFGSHVTIVELGEQLVPTADADIVKPLHKKLSAQCEVLLNTKVVDVTLHAKGLEVHFEGAAAPKSSLMYDRILCAVGRTPNSSHIGAEAIGLTLDEKGLIPVDSQMRTNIANIFAIGDVVGQPMLAHKATSEAKVAAEVIAGRTNHAFEPMGIPSVAYTNPELAWVGLTEKDAKTYNIPYKKGVFPWKASGRAHTQHATDGITKLLFEPETRRILGGAIVGAHASELIAEIGLAIEMGCTVENMELTIHPHPTLSETTLFAAEMFGGTITDLLPPKER